VSPNHLPEGAKRAGWEVDWASLMSSSIMISDRSLCGAGSWSGTGQLLRVFLSSEAYPITIPWDWVLDLKRVNEISRASSETTNPEPLPPIRVLSAVNMLNNTRSFCSVNLICHGVLRVLRLTTLTRRVSMTNMAKFPVRPVLPCVRYCASHRLYPL
jgi:hypothetical protein